MKALSIRQPWAWLICRGFKHVENRTWKIGRNPQHGPYKSQQADFSLTLPARVYVHAGKVPDWSEETENFLYRLFDADVPAGIPRPGTAPDQFGAIIGEVTIAGCVRDSKSPWAVPGQYHFLLANPVPYDKPIPCKGALGFFEPDLKGQEA